MSMSDNTRIIHTGLYADHAFFLISEILFKLQNYYGDSKKTKKMASLLNTNIKRGIDNEIILKATVLFNYYRSTRLWNGLTDNQVLRHIVWLYKGLIQRYEGSKAWKRKNNETVSFTNNKFIKISEVYFLYDMFHQRKNFKHNYPDNYSDEFIGIPLDPITVELKNAQFAEIENIENEKTRKLEELKNQKYLERDEAYKAIDLKYATLIKEVEDMADAKIKQLEIEMQNIASLNLLDNAG